LRTRVEQLARWVRADVAPTPEGVEVSNDGGVFARAAGGVLALKTGRNPGAVALEDLGDGWWSVDPWPAGVTFRRGDDLLRTAVEQAANREPA
jgi:hypothetical protein